MCVDWLNYVFMTVQTAMRIPEKDLHLISICRILFIRQTFISIYSIVFMRQTLIFVRSQRWDRRIPKRLFDCVMKISYDMARVLAPC